MRKNREPSLDKEVLNQIPLRNVQNIEDLGTYFLKILWKILEYSRGLHLETAFPNYFGNSRSFGKKER